MSDFLLALEAALSKPENEFLNVMLPLLNPPKEENLQILSRVLEHGSVVDKRYTAKLFTDYLGEIGAKHLSDNLSISKPKLFIESAEILGILKYSKAIKALEAGIYSNHPDLVLPAVKAVSLLYDDTDNESVSILAKFYLTFKDEVKLSKAIKYLIPLQKHLVPIFTESYNSADEDRKMWLLKFLAETDSKELAAFFGSELELQPLERGIYCLAALGRIGTDEAVKVLNNHIQNPEWFFRKHLAAAYGASDNANAIEPLLSFLSDSSQQVQSAAVESLSKIGNKNPKLLIEKLKSGSRKEKINLIRVMGQLRNESFLTPLLEILNNKDLLFFSIDALGDLGFAQAEAPLRKLLKNDVWFNRLNALEALAKLNIQGIVQISSEAMQDENDMVRNSAMRINALAKSSVQ
jgi:HEAT repeat protein